MLLRFGGFELDEERFELRRDGAPVPLPPRVLETLLFLARNPGQLVTKEQLIQGPWRGMAVSDSALSQSIKRARDALRRDSVASDAIVTVHGRGFRFTETVVSVPYDTTLESDDNERPSVQEPLGMRPGAPDAVRPFFGRKVELGELRAAHTASKAGQGTVVLISGEPGVGKTRLVSQFAAEQRAAGAEICWGGCREGQAAPPFWPWPEVIGRHAEAQDPKTLRRFAGATGADLTALNPELGDALGLVASDSAVESPSRTLSVLHAVTEYFRRAANEQPLVLVLEDLHLADAPSLMLFEALTRSIGDTRLLVVATCRRQQADTRPELKSALEGQWPHLQRIELEGLSLLEVSEWMARVADAPVSEEVVAALHFATGGLPLLIENAARVPRAEWESLKRDGGGNVPESLANILNTRLQNLDVETLDLLRTSAVFGEETPVAVLSMVWEKPLNALLARVETATREGFLRPSERGRLRFAHALLRDVLYQGLDAGQRLELHYRVGSAFISRLGDHPEWVVPAAHHLIESAAYEKNRDVVSTARKAADWARRQYAYGVAAEYLDKALSVLDSSPQGPRVRCETLVALAEVQALAGRVEESEQSFEQSFELSAAQGFHDLFSRALWGVFSIRREAVAVDPVFQKRLAEALEFLDEDSPHYAQLQAARAMATVLTSPIEQQVAWVEDALRVARAHDDVRARVDVLRCALHCNIWPSDGSPLLSLADEMLQHARIARSPENEFEACFWRCNGLVDLGRGTEHLEQIRDCVRQAKLSEVPLALFLATSLEAGAAYLLGSLQESERLARQAHSIGSATGALANGYLSGQLLQIGAEWTGPERDRVLGDALALAEAVLAAVPAFHLVRIGAARISYALGQFESPMGILEMIGDSGFDPGSPLARSRPPILAMLSDIVCGLGDAELAERLIEPLSVHEHLHINSTGGSVYFGPAAFSLGALSLKAGRYEHAVHYLQLAVTESARARSVTYTAWSEFYLAQALGLASGDNASERRSSLFANARRAAAKYGLGHLQTCLDRSAAAPAGDIVFRK